MMSEIRPNLFLGARSDAREHKLRENKINNVLSIEWAKPPLPKDICNKFVYVNDDPDADLLSLMPDCVKFIENAIENGGVLVHCFMGISRSSTIVAAYLMKNEKISFDDALTSIRKARPQARPNFGFRQQLDLFQKMDFKVDKENMQYKGHILRELGVAFKDFPDILHEEIDSTMDKTFSEVDLAAIGTEYEDVLSRCSSFAKENLERSIFEWLVCLRQFLRKHRKDIADYLPLDVQTRKSIQPNSDFSANRLVELKYQQGLGNGSLSDLLLTITDNNSICLEVAVYQSAGYLCFLKEFKYAVVTDSKEFVILEHKDSVTVVQRARVNDIRMFMKYYSSLFLLNKTSLK